MTYSSAFVGEAQFACADHHQTPRCMPRLQGVRQEDRDLQGPPRGAAPGTGASGSPRFVGFGADFALALDLDKGFAFGKPARALALLKARLAAVSYKMYMAAPSD